MAIANHFYNATSRKYIAVFGTIFNQLTISREDNAGTEIQKMIVPISYGPYQKFLAKLHQDPDLDQKSAVTLPRMSFEMTSMAYDGNRKVGSTQKFIPSAAYQDSEYGNLLYAPAPYNIEFNLYVMTKYAEDGTKILEQILPFFKPEWTTTVKLIDGLEPIDIPLVLNSVSAEDLYENDFQTRRSLMWTLSFTMKGYFFGPVRNKKRIKFVDARLYSNLDIDGLDPATAVQVQPGLTANGEPTTDINETVDYDTINMGDDWGIIVVYKDYEEGDV